MKEFIGYKKGINLGGWLSQCGDENYNDNHYSSFIKEDDISKIASWGADHIRVPIDYNVIQDENGDFIESGFTYIDNSLEWCNKYKLNFIFDLHKTAGFSFDDKENCDFFDNILLQDSFVKLWCEVAKRYSHLHERMAFELLNEVTDPETAGKWNEIIKRTIAAIREISTDVKIIIGGIYNNSIYGLTLLDEPADKNIVFNFHCYNPLIFTHQSAHWIDEMPRDYKLSYPALISTYSEESKKIFGHSFNNEFEGHINENIDDKFFEKLFLEAVKISEKYDVPLYCGEYGVIDKAELSGTLQWFKDIHNAFEKFGIGRAVWTYKSKDFGITDDCYAEIFDKLIKLI